MLCIAVTGHASESGDWLRQAAQVPKQGTTEWSIVVTTGHFGRDPQLVSATRQIIAELLGEVGAKGDRVRIYAAEMAVWGTPISGPIETLASMLPTSQAPGSKGGRDIEAILNEVGPVAKGPVLVFSPGDSILPLDGSGALLGGDGMVEGFSLPTKRDLSIKTVSQNRSIRLTVLSRNGLFEGTEPRIAPKITHIGAPIEVKANAVSEHSGENLGSNLWPVYAGLTLIVGAGIGYFIARRISAMSVSDALPAMSAPPDDGELAAWKEQAKQLQRRLDFLTQEIEESVQRISHSNDVQIIELRQDLVRQQKTLEAWDELVIDYLDGIQRALDHTQVSTEAAATWLRARTQMLNLSKRLGLDEIRPSPGDLLIGSQHRIEALVAPTAEYEAGVVTRLIQPGYRRADAVIRQAKVEIASEKA